MKTSIAPRTDALRHALAACDDACAADLAFLEAWEADPSPGPGAALRVAQIRRANPALAAAIRAELASQSRHAIGRSRATTAVPPAAAQSITPSHSRPGSGML